MPWHSRPSAASCEVLAMPDRYRFITLPRYTVTTVRIQAKHLQIIFSPSLCGFYLVPPSSGFFYGFRPLEATFRDKRTTVRIWFTNVVAASFLLQDSRVRNPLITPSRNHCSELLYCTRKFVTFLHSIQGIKNSRSRSYHSAP